MEKKNSPHSDNTGSKAANKPGDNPRGDPGNPETYGLVRAFEETGRPLRDQGRGAVQGRRLPSRRRDRPRPRPRGARDESLSELKEIPGIGEGIARKILEFKETGRIAGWRIERKRSRPELISLLRRPQPRPEAGRLVFDELGVRSLDDLRHAAEEHRLAGLKGPGAQGGGEHSQGHPGPAGQPRAACSSTRHATRPRRSSRPCASELPGLRVSTRRQPAAHEGDHRRHRHPGGLARGPGGG